MQVERLTNRLLLCTLAWLLGLVPLSAQHAAEEPLLELPHAARHAFRHHLALTPSFTTLLVAEGEAQTLPTLGLDYEAHIGRSMGAGLYVEALFGESAMEWMAGLPLFVHPSGHFHFLLAPELKWTEEAEAWRRTAGVRLGMAYDFHFAHLSLSPTLNADLLHELAELNYGLSVGWGF